MNDRGMLRLVGGIFAPVGIVLMLAGTWSGVRKHRIIHDWPLVDAVVTQSRVTSYNDEDGSNMHRTLIEFRYVVNGKTYTTPAASDYSSTNYVEMQRLANRYPPGSVRPVKYNPAEPDEITFTYGYNFGFFFLTIILGGMGVLFTGIGGLILWIGMRMPKLKCHKCGEKVETGQKYCPNCAAPVSPFPER